MFAPAAKIPHIGTAHSRWQPSLALDSTGANCAIASSKFATGHPPEKGYDRRREDLAATEKVRSAGELIGIRLIDHIIIGSGHFTSLCGSWNH